MPCAAAVCIAPWSGNRTPHRRCASQPPPHRTAGSGPWYFLFQIFAVAADASAPMPHRRYWLVAIGPHLLRLQICSWFPLLLVLINRRNGPRYQRVLALCAFFFVIGVIPKGFILRNFIFDFCVCFLLCKFVSGLILWFLDNLWFDDLRAE